LAATGAVDVVLAVGGWLEPLRTVAGTVGFIVVLQALPLAVLVLVLRSLTARIGEVEAGVSSLAEGERDLTKRIAPGKTSSLTPVVRGMNVFVAKVHNLILTMKLANQSSGETSRKLGTNIAAVSSASEQIAANIRSMRTNEEQLLGKIHTTVGAVAGIRSAVGEVSRQIDAQTDAMATSTSAIEQMMASIRSLGDIAEAKKLVVQELSGRSQGSAASMEAGLTVINQIAASVDTIQEFTEIINQIASQTALLAMNAAIEAAHAGEFGKGFGVVADEIRRLADSTGANAISIAATLKGTISRIHQAQEATDAANQSVQAMTGAITDVAGSVAEIVLGLEEMSEGSRQITSSLADLQTVTETVQGAAEAVGRGADTIQGSVQEVENLSELNTAAMEEMSRGIEDLAHSMLEIRDLGSTNAANLKKLEGDLGQFKTIDVFALKSGDGQPLIVWNEDAKVIPPRPARPEALPETDPGHWYDFEYTGWNVAGRSFPASNAEGCRGKRIVSINPSAHPYYEAHRRGMKRIAEEFGIHLDCYPLPAADSDAVQRRQIDQAIRERPDLIVFAANDVEASGALVRKVHAAGIPLVAATSMPSADAFPYVIGYTGTDEWGAFRQLARRFAEAAGRRGGYAIVQHVPGSGPYFARTWATITELKTVAPGMVCLEQQYTEFDRAKTKKAVLAWLKKHGAGLTGIVSADQGDALQGIVDALEEAGRRDVVVVAQGHCQVSLDLVKAGNVLATTYQPAETDGALPIALAIDYFNGIDFPPVKYLPNRLIVRENVESFYPAQW
jgi:ribose transport system substrate-binding protein